MRIPLLVLATFAVASLQPCSAATRDHLIPQYGPEWKSYGNYRHLLRKKLGLAPYDCERIMIIPDLGPEGSVSVSSKSGQARVILLTPSKSFWQSRETHEHVEIIRTEHELPNETAARFKKACERLLGDIRPLKPLDQTQQFVLWTVFHYSRSRCNELLALLSVATCPIPYPGKKTAAVEPLFQSLEAYCEGKKPGRKQLLLRIERQIAIILDQKS